MGRTDFTSPVGEVPVVNQTAVAANVDTALWLPATNAPNTVIPANSARAGQVLKLTAWGVTTTAVTAGQTLIVTPRWGQTVAASVALGVSATVPVNAVVQTNSPWYLNMLVHIRSIGQPGTNSTATCGGVFFSDTVVGTAATTNTAFIPFGTSATTATSIDCTIASALLVSVTASLATQTFQTLGVFLESAQAG